jgi:hypothetical protein
MNEHNVELIHHNFQISSVGAHQIHSDRLTVNACYLLHLTPFPSEACLNRLHFSVFIFISFHFVSGFFQRNAETAQLCSYDLQPQTRLLFVNKAHGR